MRAACAGSGTKPALARREPCLRARCVAAPHGWCARCTLAMDAPQYDKRELREALPLAATPSPASTPSSNPDSKTGAVPAKRFEMPSAAEVDELRLGFVPTVNPLQALAEMKSAAAAPPPSPAPPPAAAAHAYSPAFAPSGSSALRGASPYFASNAPVAPAKKRPLIINANQVRTAYIISCAIDVGAKTPLTATDRREIFS